ncbi:MAG: DUF1622 domain-containing protein [Desulfobacteraceae bacterium]|jgi:uncharacterized membrane protein|nr:DUF1622 domain-containing protein [Desulfobacteraceae bacterium]
MKQYFEIAYIAFETIAILVLILGAVIAMGRFIKGMLRGSERHQAYRDFRQSFGRTLLLALDLLVAADIILTVTLDLAFESLGILGLLVLIRTFLHFVLELEITGRWPWQPHTRTADDSGA